MQYLTARKITNHIFWFKKMRDKQFKGQSFSKLRRRCLRKRKLFVDGEFPPTGSSLFFSRPAPSDIVWKRPKVPRIAARQFNSFSPY